MAVKRETKYARSGDASIAYQQFGEGDRTIVIVPGFVSHLEVAWEHPPYERFMGRLASFARVVVMDKRGCGLSDPIVGPTSFEQRTDDVLAVLEAADLDRAVVFGMSEGASMAALLAATYPERIEALILYGTIIRGTVAPDYPWSVDPEAWEEMLDGLDEAWGSGISLFVLAPQRFDDDLFREWFSRFERMSASPGVVKTALELDTQIDIRAAVPTISAPTLVINRTGDFWPIEGARWLAGQIEDARLAELPGENHWPWIDDTDAVVDEIEEFLTGVRRQPEPDRVLATVLFTDIVDSTKRAAALGDSRWRELVTRHDALMRREIDRHRGREIKTMGDGFLATFDGPARAIRCASEARASMQGLEIDIRAGLHTGEVELMNGDIGGMAVNIGARVSAQAGAGEVLVSSTVKDLVVGSGIEFADRGAHELKGVPGEWRLFAVESS
jgi:class 3 adenylate cyclase